MSHVAIVLCSLIVLQPLSIAAQNGAAVTSPIVPVAAQPKQEPDAFEWRPAINQSMRFLLIQHGFRLAVQPGTRARLKGPFFQDWGESIMATGVKRRVQPMLGFKRFLNARVVIAGIEFAEKIKKQQYDLRRIGGVQASHAEMCQRTMAA